MFRYVGFVWSPSHCESQDNVDKLRRRLQDRFSELRCVCELPGLCVLIQTRRGSSMERAYNISDAGGVILGTMFRRNSDRLDSAAVQVSGLSAEESVGILKHGPSQLVRHYWGWYVAMTAGGHGRDPWIFRSPMSDLPCLHAKSHGVTVLSSDVEPLVAMNFSRFTIDWERIRLQVGFGQIAYLADSAITEIQSVVCGEALVFRAGVPETVPYWSPRDFVSYDDSETSETLQAELRSTIQSSVNAWASHHDSILHRLSGGLDSSIVLACLSRAPTEPRVTCVNYSWQGGYIDERPFARAVAEFTERELLEAQFGTSERLNVIQDIKRTAAPVLDVIDWQESERERRVARSRGATAIFMGSLGDALFERDSFISPAADSLVSAGLSRRFLHQAMKIALHRGMSVWSVIFFAVKRGWLTPARGRWSPQREMLSNGMFNANHVLVHDDAVASLQALSERFTHRWLSDARGIPLTKLWQIASLFTESFYDAHFKIDGDPRIIAPFMSQPLVELCLKIPGHLSMGRGLDRAMARSAFSAELPKSVWMRRGKGSPNPWLKAMVARDGAFVRDYLLGGVMIEQGLLDPNKLERALPGGVSASASHGGSIMNLLYTESWLRKWVSLRDVQASC